jgi:carboxylesterase
VKHDIGRVTQPLLLFRSIEDHVVEPSNAAWILANVSSADLTEVLLPDSYHVATLDNDAEQIFEGSAAFVRRVTAE